MLIRLISGAVCHGFVDSIDVVKQTVMMRGKVFVSDSSSFFPEELAISHVRFPVLFFRKNGQDLPRSGDLLAFRGASIAHVYVITSEEELTEHMKEIEMLQEQVRGSSPNFDGFSCQKCQK